MKNEELEKMMKELAAERAESENKKPEVDFIISGVIIETGK